MVPDADRDQPDREATDLPSYADVYQELVKLRNSGGLERLSIVKYAKKIMWMPFVSSEMASQGYNEDSRPEATIEALICAAAWVVEGRESKTFLHHTLVFFPSGATMEFRLRNAASVLGMYGSSLNYLKARNDKAYGRLASELLRLRNSPCPADKNIAIARAVERVDRADRAERQLSEANDDLKRLLQSFGYSYPLPIRIEAEAHLRALLVQGVAAAATSVGPRNGSLSARVLIIAGICRARDSGDIDETAISALLHQEYVSMLEYEEIVTIRSAIRSPSVSEVLRLRSRSADAYNRGLIELGLLRASAVEILAAAVRAEEDARWPSIVRPSGGISEMVHTKLQ